MNSSNKLRSDLINLEAKLLTLKGLLANNQPLYLALKLLGLSLQFMHIYGIHVNNTQVNYEYINQYMGLIDGIINNSIDGEFFGDEEKIFNDIKDISKPVWKIYSDYISDVEFKDVSAVKISVVRKLST